MSRMTNVVVGNFIGTAESPKPKIIDRVSPSPSRCLTKHGKRLHIVQREEAACRTRSLTSKAALQKEVQDKLLIISIMAPALIEPPQVNPQDPPHKEPQLVAPEPG